MQNITRYISPYRNFKLFKLLRRTHTRIASSRSTKINCDKNLKIWFPIATNLLNQRLLQLVSHPKFLLSSSSTSIPEIQLVDSVRFEKVCEETLESLTDYFEELVEDATHLKSTDVSYSVSII